MGFNGLASLRTRELLDHSSWRKGHSGQWNIQSTIIRYIELLATSRNATGQQAVILIRDFVMASGIKPSRDKYYRWIQTNGQSLLNPTNGQPLKPLRPKKEKVRTELMTPN